MSLLPKNGKSLPNLHAKSRSSPPITGSSLKKGKATLSNSIHFNDHIAENQPHQGHVMLSLDGLHPLNKPVLASKKSVRSPMKNFIEINKQVSI
jgi:hypothetical protein